MKSATSRDFNKQGLLTQKTLTSVTKNYRNFYKTLCAKLKVPMCPSILESLLTNEIEINIDDLNSDQISSLPRVLKPLRLKALKLWTTDYEIFQYSQLGIRKTRTRVTTNEKLPSESSLLLSTLLPTIALSIESSKKLTILGLFSLRLSLKSWSTLASTLENSSICTLLFPRCEISEKELESLFQAIGSMTNLSILDLSHNKITDGYLIGRIISKQGERRDTSKWEGGLRGAVAETPKGLAEIYLSDNQLEDKGWEKVLSALLSDNWLRMIDCKRNGITAKSVKSTLVALNENKSILVVDLRFNVKFERGFLKVMEVVDKNFDFVEQGSEECVRYMKMVEVIVNELELPSVCELRFMRNAKKKLKIRSLIDRKLNSVSGKMLSSQDDWEEKRKKVSSPVKNKER